jgi:hypothetical protein
MMDSSQITTLAGNVITPYQVKQPLKEKNILP